ncbi:MAG TPA: hypothetical protein VIH90_01100 [Candidatus Saccharimonadales bacterium]
MSEYVCPRTQKVCRNSICNAANAVLFDATKEVRSAVPDDKKQLPRIMHLLGKQVEEYQGVHGINLFPEVNTVRTAICPSQFIDAKGRNGMNDIMIQGYIVEVATGIIDGAVDDLTRWA